MANPFPDPTFGVQLAPGPRPYQSVADIAAENAKMEQNRLSLKAAEQADQKQNLLKAVLAKHVVADPATGRPTVDTQAVTDDLYRANPEAAQAFEQHVQDTKLARIKAAQETAGAQQTQVQNQRDFVSKLVAPIDENGDQAVAKAQYDHAVQVAKSAGIPVTSDEEVYSPDKVKYFKSALIGPKDQFDKQSQQELAGINNQSAEKRTQITADANLQGRQIGANATLGAAGIRADASRDVARIKNPSVGLTGINAQAASSTAPYRGGWTPRARNGGDNTDAAVDNKITGMARALGVDPDTDIRSLSPIQIAKALALSEGGAGSIAAKNNNPTNIRNGDGSYKTYPSSAAGTMAAANLVRRKLASGQTTIRTLVEGLPVNGGVGGTTPTQAAGNTTADQVIGYKGPSALTKQGEMSLRTFPDIKQLVDTKFDSQIVKMQELADAINRGAKTGPGQAINNSINRGKVALDNVLGTHLADNSTKQAVSDYATISNAQGEELSAALQALRPASDKDVDVVLSRIIGNAQSGQFNKAMANQSVALLNLAKEKRSFYIKWANAVGSPLSTYGGKTAAEAWDEYSAPKLKAITQKFGTQSQERSAAGAPKVVRSENDFKALPKGTRFVFNGRTYEK